MYNSRKRHTIAELGTYANTTVTDCQTGTAITLHKTTIARIWGDGTVSFYTGGHNTPTTKKRINEIANILKLDSRLHQEKGQFVWRNLDNREVHRDHFDGTTFKIPA